MERITFEGLRHIEECAARALKSHAALGSRILVAVSGGPDSVALAHLLRRLPYSLVLAHVDHRIRRQSGRDARFVRRLARSWDLPYDEMRVDVPRYAARHKLGLEEAARLLRYRSLYRLAQKHRCSVVVTAHTADDQAETVLMNFLRGAGPTGLAGIHADRPLKANRHRTVLVRPFLSVRKSEIFLYLKHNQLPFRHDSSNRDLAFTRNWVRLRLLPGLEKKFPGLSGRLAQTADIFREEEAYWQQEFQSRQSKRIDLTKPFRYHRAIARRKLRLLHPGMSFQDVNQLLHRA